MFQAGPVGRLCGAFKIVGLSLFAVVSAAGCGSGDTRPPSVRVTGKVTFAGAPVTEGVVNFVSTKTGNAGSGMLNADGDYEISEGIPAGSYQVFVSPPRVTKPPMIGEPPVSMEYPNIPEKVRNEASSGLTAELKTGENPGVDFRLD